MSSRHPAVECDQLLKTQLEWKRHWHQQPHHRVDSLPVKIHTLSEQVAEWHEYSAALQQLLEVFLHSLH